MGPVQRARQYEAHSYKDMEYSRPKAELSLELLKKTLHWVRCINPLQPITMAPWQWADMVHFLNWISYMFTHSDVISFHCYEERSRLEKSDPLHESL